MLNSKVHDQGSNASTDHGTVHVEGPAGIDFDLTAKAALQTANNIEQAAIDAIFEDFRHPARAPGNIATSAG